MLKQALRPNRSQAQTAIGASIPAPVKGWDAISPLAKMDPQNAVILRNWIPRAGYVEVRKGSRDYMTGAGDPVESLLTWRGDPTGVDKLFAVADTGVFPITDLSDPWPASVKTVSNPRIQSANFANDGGSFIINVNGDDTPFRYDGATWANLTITGSSGPITLDPQDLIDVCTHKSRLHFLEKGTLRTWYLDTNAIQGTAQLLDLGPLFKEGGTLNAIDTWSSPFGLGQDDYFVALTSEGEVAVYQGDDPSNVLYWTQVGLFQIGKPLGRRSLFKFGGDLIALTTNGVISFNQAIKLDRSQQNAVALTQKIQNAFLDATKAYSANFGWDAIFYQEEALALYNIPIEELGISYQYVQNLQNGAWCEFRGLNAFCWATANEAIYFGGEDGVYQANKGVTDSDMDLNYDCLSAFNYFGSPRQKNFTMVRPIFNATANIQPAVEIDADFVISTPTATPTVIDTHTTAMTVRKDWNGATGVGFCGALHISGSLSAADFGRDSLGVGGGTGDVIGDGAGNIIVVASGEPFSAAIQYIGADLLYTAGGPL